MSDTREAHETREFRLPDLGEGLTGAEIVRWLVEVGDVVTVDQPVVEVETAKAQVEVPCPHAGVVTARHGDPGHEIPVGAPLVTVAADAPPDSSPDSASGTSGNVLVGYGTSAEPGSVPDAAPPTRRRRRTPAPPPSAVSAPPPAPAPASAASASASGASGRRPAPVVSPLVRRLARERGVDLHTVTGSGPDGLILRADVERAAAPAPSPAPAPTPAPVAVPTAAPTPPAEGGTRIPLRGVAGAMADKLTRSRDEIPDATCWVDADATELRAACRRTGLPLLALLARFCTAALARHPELNATVDTAAREIVRLPAVHLGYAAQTDRGLLVPVVRDAHTRTTRGLAEEMGRLTSLARAGSLPPGDLTGGTFTLNNYGVFGVDGSTPILNHPEAAMLGVGRITQKPWAHEGALALRDVVQLSLTFDHRVCDGGTAGAFLRYIADCVEDPSLLLADL